MIVTKCHHDYINYNALFSRLGCEAELVGQKSVELIVFDILKDHVSIHQPLPRVIASTLPA